MNNFYTPAENNTWSCLIKKRKKSLENQASALFIDGFQKLQLPIEYIPTTQEMNSLLKPLSCWRMIPTTKLVLACDYFKMLSNCLFPVITTMRPSDEMDYYTSPKPDVIHEYFGHGPFLTNVEYSNFMQRLALISMKYEQREQVLLSRLFWYTIEFGLIQTPEGLRAYGAGIIPSEAESEHALLSALPSRREFNITDILRTPFSARSKQMIYYVIPSFDNLFSILDSDFDEPIKQAYKLGSF